MDDDGGESSEAEGGRIAVIQQQARRRALNARHASRQSTDTTATLPEYTSSPPATPRTGARMTRAENKTELPPRYPQLTAEEEDEERDEVGDVVRRVRVRRRRSYGSAGSGSDPYLDSLLARSVHALELSNALLQSSMTTQSSLSALLSHDDHMMDRSLDSHAQFLTNQIRASDARRAWVDDIARQVESLDYVPSSPVGLSQSLPDTQNGFIERMMAAREADDVPPARPRKREGGSGGLQQGDRPRSPPPRCMTQYITAEGNVSDGPDSILLPSTNGLRAGAKLHGFVSVGDGRVGSRNHSRKSSADWDGTFARQQQVPGWTHSPSTSTPVSPRSSNLHSPRRSMSASTHSPHASISSLANRSFSPNVYQHGNASSPQLLQFQRQPHTPNQQYSSHQPYTPVRPVLSAVPAEPSTPAYNMLSAIAMKSPTPNGNVSDGGTMSDFGPRVINDLRGSGRGRGGSGTWVRGGPLGLGAGPKPGSGLRRARSVTPSSTSRVELGIGAGGNSGLGSPAVSSPKQRAAGSSTGTGTETSTSMSSPSKPTTRVLGTASPVKSRPPTRTSSRNPSTTSVSSLPGHPSASIPSPGQQGPTSSPGRIVRHPFLQPDPHQWRQNQIQTQSDTEADAEALHKFRSAEALRRILGASKPQHEEPEDEHEHEDEEEERGRGTVRALDATKGKQPAVSRGTAARPRPKLPTWSMIPRTPTAAKIETFAPGGIVSIEGISGGTVSTPTAGSSKSAVDPKLDPLELPGEHGPGLRISGPVRSKSVGPGNRLGSLFSASLPLPKIPVFGKGGVSGAERDAEPPPETNPHGPERPTVKNVSRSDSTTKPRLERINTGIDGLPTMPSEDAGSNTEGLPNKNQHMSSSMLRVQLNGATIDTDAGPSGPPEESSSENDSECASHASLPLPPRLFGSYGSGHRPSSLRLPDSPRPSSFRQYGSGASTPRSVTFSPLPPKHVSAGTRPLSDAKARRKKKKDTQEKPGWFASWFGPLPSPTGSTASGPKTVYGVTRRGWDSPRSMEDWQM